MKKLWIPLMLLLLLSGYALAEEPALYPIRRNEKWGYIDREGNETIPPQWDDANFFSGGVAVIGTKTVDPDGTVWLAQGLIDGQGKMILEPRYIFYEDANIIDVNECFPVEGAEEYDEYVLAGYYDRASGFFLQPQYDSVYDGGPGHVIFAPDDSGTVGCLRADTGEVLIPPSFVYLSDFSEGWALAEPEGASDDFLLIDETGAAASFPEGVIPCSSVRGGTLIIRNEQMDFGLARPDGTVLLAPSFNDLDYYLADGLYLYQTEAAGPWGMMDDTGRIITEPRITGSWEPNADHGLLLFTVEADGENREVLMDRTGRVLFSEDAEPGPDLFASLPAQATANRSFSLLEILPDGDRVWYSLTYGESWDERNKNMRYGLIQIENGQAGYLTGPVFEDYGGDSWAWEDNDFHEGLAPAMRDGLWGYIDRQGQWVIPPQWQLADKFRGGLALVYGEDDRMAYIDAQGAVVWQETAPGQE